MDSSQYGVQVVQSDIDTTSGTYSHSDNTTEQDAFVYTLLKDNIEVTLDMTNLTQRTTVRVYEKIDGTNYRLVDSGIYPDDFDVNKGILVEFNGKNIDCKITLQSIVTEGASRNISWARSNVIRV